MDNIVEFENDKVRVTRVKASGPGPGSDAAVSRLDRLIIYLQDGHVRHKVVDREHNILLRRAGDVVWRPASQHDVTVVHTGDHEVLVVELK